MEKVYFGAIESEEDYRTVIGGDKSGMPPNEDIVPLNFETVNDLCHQKAIGICTKCAVRMGQENYHRDGVRLSEYWGYLMGKVLVDGNLTEGSSAFTMLKSAQKYGTPTQSIEKTFPLKTDGSYTEFIEHFKNAYRGQIPTQVLENAKAHKIPGYYKVNVDPISIAREISNGKVVIARFVVGENTYTARDGRVSWQEKDLLPLRAPQKVEGGHLWCINEYKGLDSNQWAKGPNSWSRAWGANGYFYFNFEEQKRFFTEAWAISDKPFEINKPPMFKKQFGLGTRDAEVKMLQKFLNDNGFTVSKTGLGSKGKETDFFGKLTWDALKKFQRANKIQSTGYFGPITQTYINKMLINKSQMGTVKQGYDWLIKSSENPQNVSLTIKGIAVFLVPIAVSIIRSKGFDIQESDVNKIVMDATQMVGMIVAFIGFVRKLYNTRK